VNDESLDPLLLDELGIADILPSLTVIVAGIVEEARGLGCTAEHASTTLSTVEEPTEQVLAVERARMGDLRASLPQQGAHLLKHLPASNGRVSVFNADDLFRVLGLCPPLTLGLPVPN
jgi:hypothetical protein